jgi:hypothetical protein
MKARFFTLLILCLLSGYEARCQYEFELKSSFIFDYDIMNTDQLHITYRLVYGPTNANNTCQNFSYYISITNKTIHTISLNGATAYCAIQSNECTAGPRGAINLNGYLNAKQTRNWRFDIWDRVGTRPGAPGVHTENFKFLTEIDQTGDVRVITPEDMADKDWRYLGLNSGVKIYYKRYMAYMHNSPTKYLVNNFHWVADIKLVNTTSNKVSVSFEKLLCYCADGSVDDGAFGNKIFINPNSEQVIHSDLTHPCKEYTFITKISTTTIVKIE